MPVASTDQLLEDSWRYNLDTYAVHVSGGKWTPHPWAVYVARALTDAVLNGGARIIIEAPPRHGKSELTSRWLATWYLDTFPTRRVILASYAGGLASDWSQKVRDTLAGSPDSLSVINRKHNRGDDWQLLDGGGMRAVGVASGVTGFGADLIVIDDPHKDWAEVQSATNRRKVVSWFNGTLYHRLEPGGSIVLIQTRWHEGDLAGYLVDEHEDDWTRIRLPALAEAGDLLGRSEGEALCPERYTADQLRKIERSVGPWVFAGLFQQRPAPLEGGMVKSAWVHYYDEAPKTFDELLQSWDLACKGGEEHSYVVGQVWGRKDANCYLLDQIRRQMTFPDTLKAFQELSLRWPLARRKLVEDKANAAALISTLKGKVPGIVPVLPRGDKEFRLASVTPLFEAGNVLFPNPRAVPWVKDLVHELLTFPGSKTDDQVDTTSQALTKLANSALARLRKLATR